MNWEQFSRHLTDIIYEKSCSFCRDNPDLDCYGCRIDRTICNHDPDDTMYGKVCGITDELEDAVEEMIDALKEHYEEVKKYE